VRAPGGDDRGTHKTKHGMPQRQHVEGR
jgi:hypothetical protein